jgi:hypothetical protein
MIKEILQFNKSSNHIWSEELEAVGSNSVETNLEDSVVYLTAQAFTGLSPTNQSRAGGYTKLAFNVENRDSSIALADFALYIQASKDATALNVLSGSTWGTVAGILKHKVGALNTLAADAVGYAQVDIGPCYAIQFRAKSAGADLLTNGAFTGNANSWSLGTGWAYGTNNVAATVASGTLSQAKADMDSAGVLFTSGPIFVVSFTISGYSGGSLTVGTAADPSQSEQVVVAADGTYSMKIQGDGDADGLIFTGVNFTGVIDTVSMKRCASLAVTGSLFA